MRELSVGWPRLLGYTVAVAAVGIILWVLQKWWAALELSRSGHGTGSLGGFEAYCLAFGFLLLLLASPRVRGS